MKTPVRERPITFSAPMIQAILDGRKSQTRRIVKQPKKWPQYSYCDPFAMPPAVWWWNGKYENVGVRQECPYGVVGDRLWVRETWGHDAASVEDCRRSYEDMMGGGGFGPYYKATAREFDISTIKWKPSIHMPRWASRILLEITGVRVERVQDITEEDAIAEGVFKSCSAPLVVKGEGLQVVTLWDGREELYFQGAAKSAYLELFTSIYGLDAIEKNPWNWVLDFKEVE